MQLVSLVVVVLMSWYGIALISASTKKRSRSRSRRR
jgi:hypothetical protein